MSSADDSPRHTLESLATLAGLTPRTVRYYIQQGLVDRPLGEKRGAYYLARHLEQRPRQRDHGAEIELSG